MINIDYEKVPGEQLPQLYISDDERVLVKKHIILPFVIKVLEHDKKIFSGLPLKASVPYIEKLDHRIIEVFQDVNSVQKQLREQSIKVYEVKRDNKMGYWEYILRGNRHEMGFMWSIVRTEVELYLMEKFGLRY